LTPAIFKARLIYLEGFKVAMKWYIIQTYSRHENKVKAALQEYIVNHRLEASFGEILIPTESIVKFISGQKRTVSRKLYPGYVFIQMNLNEDMLHLVKSIPKVIGFIGNKMPDAVPNKQIKRVIQQMTKGIIKPRPTMVFQEGDIIRVTDGPFSNFTGTIDEVRPDKQRVRMKMSILGRPTSIELNYIQIEKI
jgi:transcriptional antiterminator NusG